MQGFNSQRRRFNYRDHSEKLSKWCFFLPLLIVSITDIQDCINVNGLIIIFPVYPTLFSFMAHSVCLNWTSDGVWWKDVAIHALLCPVRRVLTSSNPLLVPHHPPPLTGLLHTADGRCPAPPCSRSAPPVPTAPGIEPFVCSSRSPGV